MNCGAFSVIPCHQANMLCVLDVLAHPAQKPIVTLIFGRYFNGNKKLPSRPYDAVDRTARVKSHAAWTRKFFNHLPFSEERSSDAEAKKTGSGREVRV
jgi:hypothetical protein